MSKSPSIMFYFQHAKGRREISGTNHIHMLVIQIYVSNRIKRGWETLRNLFLHRLPFPYFMASFLWYVFQENPQTLGPISKLKISVFMTINTIHTFFFESSFETCWDETRVCYCISDPETKMLLRALRLSRSLGFVF